MIKSVSVTPNIKKEGKENTNLNLLKKKIDVAMSTEVREEETGAALEEKVQEEAIGRLREGAADQHQAHIIRQLRPITKDHVNLLHGKTKKVIQVIDRARHGSHLLLSPDPTLGGHLVSEEVQKTLRWRLLRGNTTSGTSKLPTRNIRNHHGK